MNGWEQNDRAAAIAAQAWVNDGAKQERERIIEIIKGFRHVFSEEHFDCHVCVTLNQVIALIEGENK